MFYPKSTALQKLELPEIHRRQVELWVWRLDQIDAIASGNKFFKLQPYFDFIKKHDYQRVLSFGGAFSNHVHALAYYAHKHNVKCELFIRGEQSSQLNSTLFDVQQWGANLHFIDRQLYRKKHERNFLKDLQGQYSDALIIPEGGGGELGIQGAQQMAHYLSQLLSEKKLQFDHIAMACGTGSSFVGFAEALGSLSAEGTLQVEDSSPANGSLPANGLPQLIAMPVLKGVSDLYATLEGLNACEDKHVLVDKNAHYGGYAKCPSFLREFAQHIYQEYELPLDPVYTVKILYRLMEKIKQGEFRQGSKVLMVHTGGLQGCRGFSHHGENWPYQYRIADENSL